MVEQKKKLTRQECEEVLKSNDIGVLSVTNGQYPYAVPVEFLYQDNGIYVGTYVTGRKMDYLAGNSRGAFVVYESRHANREMIRKKIPCRSVMVEGPVTVVDDREFETRHGGKRAYRLIRLDIEEMGSWRCNRGTCSLVVGRDFRKELRDWAAEAALKSEE